MHGFHSYEEYRKFCYQLLHIDCVEGIEHVFDSLQKVHPEFRQPFLSQFHGWILNHFFIPSLQSGYMSEIILAWESENRDWHNKLKTALLSKCLGPTARGMCASLLAFEAEFCMKKC